MVIAQFDLTDWPAGCIDLPEIVARLVAHRGARQGHG
jgi:hypothetical protein